MRTQLDRIRRWSAGHVDAMAARSWRRLHPGPAITWDGDPRFAVLTVNYSTTRWLKILLLSLADQHELASIVSIVICDNGSRDGGIAFLRQLESACPAVHVVDNRLWTNHARGMRLAIKSLEKSEQAMPVMRRANVYWHLDPDVMLIDPGVTGLLAAAFRKPETSFLGELRRGVHPLPEAQASFLAVRRDWADRRDVSPWMHGGSPAWPQQRDIWRLGGAGLDLPVYRQGMVIHRGRAGVAAAAEHHPGSAHATGTDRVPHFMGVEGAEARWDAAEARFADWLEPESETALVAHLFERFQSLA